MLSVVKNLFSSFSPETKASSLCKKKKITTHEHEHESHGHEEHGHGDHGDEEGETEMFYHLITFK